MISITNRIKEKAPAGIGVPTSACAKDREVSLTHLFFNTLIIRDIEKTVNL